MLPISRVGLGFNSGLKDEPDPSTLTAERITNVGAPSDRHSSYGSPGSGPCIASL